MKSFLSRFHSLVCFVLSGFDRLRFWGESRLLNHVGGVNSYMYQRGILRRDFPKHCEELTRRLREESYAQANREGVPLLHLNSPKVEKDIIALELARTHNRSDGRIALLTSMEMAMTYRLRQTEQGFVEPRKEPTRCLHLYHYFLHNRFGLCYVRVQTWFPFTIRVGLNGRLWLARELEKRGIPFQRHRNLITAVDDPDLAQGLLHAQTRADWPALLSELVQPFMPLWSFLHDDIRTPYYWMTEQSEWATDLVFRSPDDLARWYPRWIRHGLETLNKVSRFKVFRVKEGEDPAAPKSWQQMRKGVADLPRRAEIGQAINNRLAESLASLGESTPLGQLLKPLGQPVVQDGRRLARALNPLTGADGELLRALGNGDFLLNGFRNRDLRLALYGDSTDAAQRRKQSAAITRRLALARAHGLIVKLPKTHRYQLSAEGKRIITALLAAHAANANRLADAA